MGIFRAAQSTTGKDRHIRSRTFSYEIQFRTTFIWSFFWSDAYFLLRRAPNRIYFPILNIGTYLYIDPLAHELAVFLFRFMAWYVSTNTGGYDYTQNERIWSFYTCCTDRNSWSLKIQSRGSGSQLRPQVLTLTPSATAQLNMPSHPLTLLALGILALFPLHIHGAYLWLCPSFLFSGSGAAPRMFQPATLGTCVTAFLQVSLKQ